MGCSITFTSIMKIPLISSLFKNKSREAGWFAIILGDEGVGLAKIALAGAKPLVVRCEYRPLSSISAVTLEKLCREAGIGNHHFTTVLASGEYQMLLVEAPNVPANELKTAVRWKIKDGLSYHIDDATVDVLRVPAVKSGIERAQSIYAVAAPNATIQKHTKLFQDAGIELGVIDIPEMAQRNIAALFEEEGRALVVMTFDSSGGLITFTADGELLMSRHIEVSVGQLRDADEDLRGQQHGRVELELQRSLDYFDRQFNHLPVSRVLVSAPEDTGLIVFLRRELGITVEKLDVSQVMDIAAVPDLLDEDFSARMLLVLGAALRKERRAL